MAKSLQTVTHCVEEFMAGLASPHTRANHVADVRSLNAWFDPWTGYESRLEIAKYTRWLHEGQKLELTTIRERIGRIKRLYAFLVLQKIRTDNPVDLKFAPKVKNRRQPKAPDLDEVRRLLKLLDINSDAGLRDATAIGLMLFEAIRCHEVVKLSVGDVECVNGGVRLTVRGKRGTIDHIECLAPSAKLLKKFMRTHKGRHKKEPLFTSVRQPNKRLSTRGLRFVVDAYFKKAKIRSGLSCHSLRGFHATVLLIQGYPITFIQSRLRHSTVDSTFSYLAHCPTLSASVLKPVESIFPTNLVKGLR